MEKIQNIQKIYVVGSGKGGVGKSTITLNLALSLSHRGFKVGVLDGDIYGPSLTRLLKYNHKPEVNDVGLMVAPVCKGIKIMSIGLLVPDSQAVVWRGPMVQKALTQMLWGTDWGALDFLFIDLPPGTGDIQLTLCQKAPLTGAIIITTPQDLSRADARKSIQMFNTVKTPIVGIIENMSHFTCPHCNKNSDIFDTMSEEQKNQKGVPFVGKVPLNKEIRSFDSSFTQNLFDELSRSIV